MHGDPQPLDHRSVRGASGRGARFLLVHRNDASARAVRRVLVDHFAADVLEARDGGEARRAIIDRQPSLVLCDLDAVELSRRSFLAAHGAWTKLGAAPIVAIVPQSHAVHSLELTEEGVADFVPKPFEDVELVARVRLQLRARILDSELRAARQKLESLVVLDEQTGLYNRRQLESILTAEYRRYVRYRTPVSLVLIAVEGLRSVSQRFGAAKHDEVIRKISDLVASSVRGTDWVARSGDAELAVVLPHTDAAQAALVVERLQARVNELKHAIAGALHRYPAAFGLAGCDEHTHGPLALAEHAAAALVTARKTGRVEVWSPDVSERRYGAGGSGR